LTETAQSFRLKVVLSFDLIYKLLSIWISFDTLYYIHRKGTQPKIHETYNFSLNLFGLLPYIFHEGFMKASVMLISKFHIRRLATYHSLHEIYKAKGRKGLVKNCKYFRKQILVFMNENYDPAFFYCDHCIRKNALKMLF
jgi:hypothetical protein